MSTILLLVISIVAPWTVHLAPPRQRALALVGVIAVFLLYGIFAENPAHPVGDVGRPGGRDPDGHVPRRRRRPGGLAAPCPRTVAAGAAGPGFLRGGQRAHRRALGPRSSPSGASGVGALEVGADQALRPVRLLEQHQPAPQRLDAVRLVAGGEQGDAQGRNASA